MVGLQQLQRLLNHPHRSVARPSLVFVARRPHSAASPSPCQRTVRSPVRPAINRRSIDVVHAQIQRPFNNRTARRSCSHAPGSPARPARRCHLVPSLARFRVGIASSSAILRSPGIVLGVSASARRRSSARHGSPASKTHASDFRASSFPIAHKTLSNSALHRAQQS